MYIDSHVHCRDDEESKKETNEHALRVAEDSGLSGIFAEPNTKRPITTRQRVLDSFALAKQADSEVFFGVIMGLTANENQAREAVEAYKEFFPKKAGDKMGVVGFKLYMGESVGDLAVVEYEKQEAIYGWLSEYDDVPIIVQNHCEKKSLMRPDLWDSKNPSAISHSEARPEESEVDSVRDLIKILEKTGFARKGTPGKAQVEHVSVGKSVKLINQAKEYFNISCSATPHHLLLDTDMIKDEYGILYKVNPPIRQPGTREGLFECFLDGEIDILATDHAPHTLAEKTGKTFNAKGEPQYLSGIPNLASWPDFIELLKQRGASKGLIDDMAYNNVLAIFRLNGGIIPRLERKIKDEVHEAHLGWYAFDAYKRLKGDEE